MDQQKGIKLNKILYLSLLFASLVPAAQASDFQSPRSAALGGAGHAGPLLNDSIFLNPSFASFLPTYSVTGNYVTFKGSDAPEGGTPSLHGRAYSLSVQDGRTEAFQAGLAYTVTEQGPFVHVGLSRGLSERLSIGVGGKFWFKSGSQRNGRDFALSATYIPSEWLQLALIGDNLIQSDAARDRDLYREFTLGTKFNVQGIVLVYFDPHVATDLTGQTYGHEVGLEFVMMQDLFLRVGGFRNSRVPFENAHGRGYGIGFGWVAPRLSIDYGISRALSPVAATAHVLGATVYF
jgi:hypothetical protein